MTRMYLEDIWTPRVLSVLRMVAALILVAHGMQTLLILPASEFAPGSPPPLRIAGLLEFGASGLMLLGLFTRLAAIVLTVQMATTYWMVHALQEPSAALDGKDAAGLYCFVFLYLVFAGPGPWSLDEVWIRSRAVRTGPLS